MASAGASRAFCWIVVELLSISYLGKSAYLYRDRKRKDNKKKVASDNVGDDWTFQVAADGVGPPPINITLAYGDSRSVGQFVNNVLRWGCEAKNTVSLLARATERDLAHPDRGSTSEAIDVSCVRGSLPKQVDVIVDVHERLMGMARLRFEFLVSPECWNRADRLRRRRGRRRSPKYLGPDDWNHLEWVDGIGASYTRRLARGGVRSLRDLVYLEPSSVRIPGVGTERLKLWQKMAKILVVFPELDGNDAEVLVKGLKLGSVAEVRAAQGRFSRSQISRALTKLRLPSKYDGRRLRPLLGI